MKSEKKNHTELLINIYEENGTFCSLNITNKFLQQAFIKTLIKYKRDIFNMNRNFICLLT